MNWRTRTHLGYWFTLGWALGTVVDIIVKLEGGFTKISWEHLCVENVCVIAGLMIATIVVENVFHD